MSREEKPIKNTQPLAKAEQPNDEYENSPGKQLSRAREALGLTQQQVADRLHLRMHSVQAVEEDALEKGVSVTFSKGYVRLYAKLVRLEVQPLLDAYDKIHVRNNQPAKLQSFSRRVSREADDHRWNMVTIVVVLLVLGSVIGWWVQQSDSLTTSQSFVSETFDRLFSESEQANSEQYANTAEQIKNEDILMQNTGPQIAEEDVATIIDTPATVIDVGEDESLSQSGAGSVDDSLDYSLNNTNEILESSADLEATLLTSLAEGSQELGDTSLTVAQTSNITTVNADGTVDMAFTFKDDTWVSVKDVNDEVIAIGIKTKGRVMEVSGLPPIQVVLGVPQHVDIYFGGKDIDMSIYPEGRSASFFLYVGSE
ncbi:MAG: cytoskeleton protein RodZ [Glaciecola sp.]|jgi:cytoskeleton protein RodZ